MRIFIALSLSLAVTRFFFFPAQRYFQRFFGRLLDCDSSTECIRESNPRPSSRLLTVLITTLNNKTTFWHRAYNCNLTSESVVSSLWMNHVRTTRPIKLDGGKDAAELKATLENTFGLFFFLESKSLKPTGREKINIENRRKAKRLAKHPDGLGLEAEEKLIFPHLFMFLLVIPRFWESNATTGCLHSGARVFRLHLTDSVDSSDEIFFYSYLQMTLDVIPTGRRVLNSSKVLWGKPHLRSLPLNLLMRAYTVISSDSRR